MYIGVYNSIFIAYDKLTIVRACVRRVFLKSPPPPQDKDTGNNIKVRAETKNKNKIKIRCHHAWTYLQLTRQGLLEN